MSFGGTGKLSFWVCGLDIRAFEPYHLIFCKGVRRGVESLLFHDFRGNFEGSNDLHSELVECFHLIFNRWYTRGQGEWGKEFQLEFIPYLKG